ncbi:MAG: lyase family protein [Promethearchaeota archaeon]|jgi:adenylosuccinate lyase
MIERYSTKEISEIWDDPLNRIKIFIRIECLLNDALQMLEVIDKNKLSELLFLVDPEIIYKRAKEIEEETEHDINAFVFALEEAVPEDGRWIHYGLTSSDLIDTANAVMIKDSLIVIRQALGKLEATLKRTIDRTKGIEIAGRTHGVHAETVELSELFRSFKNEVARNIDRMIDTRSRAIAGKVSGAVGDYKYFPRGVGNHVLNSLGVQHETDIGQVVARDRYAELFNTLALIGCSLERFVMQVRLHHQSGIDEIKEGFSFKQTGSSAMPHKRNPIKSENVCGLSRLLRGYALTAMQNVALWNQRDISHSSTERVILPDSFHILHFMILRTISIFENLQINENLIKVKVNTEGIQ